MLIIFCFLTPINTILGGGGPTNLDTLPSHPVLLRTCSAFHGCNTNGFVCLKYLKESSAESGDATQGFEDFCLNALSQKFSTTLPEAVYTLARQLYINGVCKYLWHAQNVCPSTIC